MQYNEIILSAQDELIKLAEQKHQEILAYMESKIGHQAETIGDITNNLGLPFYTSYIRWTNLLNELNKDLI